MADEIRFYDKLRKHVDREQKQMSQPFPVQVLLGERQDGVHRSMSAASMPPAENTATLRGLVSDVADMEAKILAFVEEAQKDELERGYTTVFDFPAKFNGYLIGREGARIKELRDQFDVDIKMMDDGKIEVRGPKAKADACKEHISGLRKKYEDEATYVLKIEPRFHGQLVGKKGADVNRLQDKYTVKIQFPQSSSLHDDQSNADATSDAGGRRPARSNQAQDEVVIRGPRQGADKARTEILDLYQYAKDNSHSATISVARQHLGSLIGQRGSEIERVRLDTGAQIDFPDRQETADPKARAEIVMKGTKQAVDAAKVEIQKKVKVLDDTVTRSLEVDRKYHGSLIGAQGKSCYIFLSPASAHMFLGANIRRMVVEAGGPDQSHQVVKFPERGSESSMIRIEGPQTVVAQVVAAIEKFVVDQENQVSDTVDVPSEKHGQLIGPRGEAKRNLEQQFNVSVEIPKKGSDRKDIKIIGAQESVARAKEYLAGLADQRKEGETIDVPKHLHHAISANGKFFWRLKNDHGVTVDHGGMKPPTRPKGSNPRPPTNGNAAPLITDGDSTDAHSWVVVPAEGAESEDDGSTIPWILSGQSIDQLAAAKERIKRALEAASKPSATGYLTLSDPRYYRFVIGPGGRNINSIRDQTGCTIQVPNPRAGNGDRDAIEIVGSADGCEEAKELVLEFVRNGAARG
jgi:predicted PilT family ATPase